MAHQVWSHSPYIMTSLLVIATITLESRSHTLRLNSLTDASHRNNTGSDSREGHKNWVFLGPVPVGLKRGPKPQRSKRSVHKEKVPPYFVTSQSPYSSIVTLNIGCIGTLISPMHVLTAAHCVHDGKQLRSDHMTRPLKIGLLRPNGKQHKIRVKKIFVSKEIQPTMESRVTYDYAVLKLVRRHRRPYLPVKASVGSIRSLKFHVVERDRGRDFRSLYKFTHCPIYNNSKSTLLQVLTKHCPSSGGDSGAAVFDNDDEKRHSIIGILSATAKFREKTGHCQATLILRLSQSDVNKINGWIGN